MATIELVAQDNHERARRLMKELNQMQHEYLELQKQVRVRNLPASLGQRGPLTSSATGLRQTALPLLISGGQCHSVTG